jgi:signal transduction histidine kinase
VFEPTFSVKATVRIANIHDDPRYGHNPPHHGMPEGHLPVVSYLAVPVISTSGAVIGGLFFGHPEAGVFTEEHEAIVENIASSAAIAIDNSRLFENVKALSAKKDEFIALASHELKTPLTTIKGYLQVLERMDMDLKAKQFLGKIVRQTEKLHDLIADLLDASRVDAGKLLLNKTPFDLRMLVREIADTENYINKTHRIILQENGTDFNVVADNQRIEQVIVNLLTNAVKYSPRGDQVIMELTDSTTEVSLKVKDFGIGLTERQQEQVFTRFYRAEGIGHIAGLGLGLYLSKEIIDRHGGAIGVKSETGAGSEFCFKLPKT